jgi:NitT/TauT family transport system substrate-binding protein
MKTPQCAPGAWMRKLAVSFAVAAATLSAQAQDDVRMRFSWKLKGEYAPLYVAQEKGYFAKQNLNVRLGEGAGAPAALGALLQGQEDVVLLPGVFALTAISKGMPVKLIALYHPKTPVALISMPDNPVRTPKDLEGKSLAVSVGETGTTYINSFCVANGVDCNKVRKVMMNPQSRVAQFVQRQVDTVTVYQTNDLPILQETQKTDFVILELDKHGLSVPGMALVTSDALLAKKPETLRKLLQAVGEGITESRRDPAEAAKTLGKYWPSAPSQSIVTAQVKATVAAVPADTGKPVGWVDEKVIAEALAMLKSTGEIEDPKPAGSYFTNQLFDVK